MSEHMSVRSDETPATGSESSPTTVLLRSDRDAASVHETWAPLWAQRDPDETNVLAITDTRSPVEWLDAWEHHIGDLPPKLGVIRIGGSMESVAPLDRFQYQQADAPLTAVERPGDLAELYTAIDLYLDEWAHTDQRTIVWIDSLTPLLDHVEIGHFTEFLDALTSRLGTAGAVAYAHLDANDERTAELVSPLFDTAIESVGRLHVPPTGLPDGLLEPPRRRRLLAVLGEADGSLPIGELAARIARRENDDRPDENAPVDANLVHIDLYHDHLPNLTDAGLLSADRTSDAVSLAITVDRLRSYQTRFNINKTVELSDTENNDA